MKFDDFIIVGNPPYQKMDGGFGTSATPLYNEFVDFAKSLNPEFICMIIPSRWFTGGKGLDKFRKSMINDPQIRIIEDFPDTKDKNGNEIFPDAEIKGGVSYFIWKRGSSGLCIFNGGERVLNEECQKGVLIRYNDAIPILRKLNFFCNSFNIITLDTKVIGRNPFGFPTTYKGTTTRDANSLRLWARDSSETYVNSSEITKGHDLIPKWKVLLAKASEGSGKVPNRICGQPIIAGPNEVCTDTYLVIDVFDTEAETNNFRSYIRTKFFRFLLGILKTTQDANKDKFALIPAMNMAHKWSDIQLYSYFNLSEKEQRFIESMILDMPID